MEPLILKASKSSPLVWIDAVAATGVVAGNSLPENAADFYGKITNWMDGQLPSITKPMKWQFRLTYFNTSSTKGIYQMLLRIKARMDQGCADSVLWDVEEDDEFMKEAGENYMDMLGMPIEFRSLSEESTLLENQKLNIALEGRLA